MASSHENQRGVVPLYANHGGPITLHLPDGSRKEASMADAMELMDLEDALPSAEPAPSPLPPQHGEDVA